VVTVKHIFVTGGVASALGKGITAASLGRLLKDRGLRVTLQKLDPYLNVDPGTMNPFEHGEVFVTDDGGETDLDLGHYERFIDESLHRGSSVSSGQIWLSVINKERRGDYLGKTVQVIPHITDEIQARIRGVADDVDVVITEVGGTVGDIEGLPFLEAIRQLRHEIGRENICYVHCALVPWIGAAGELKTKPAQHSVRELRAVGIQPDVLVLRSDRDLDEGLRRKVALQCDVDIDAVVAAVDRSSLYDVPLAMRDEGLDRVVAKKLGLPEAEPDLTEWNEVVRKVHAARETVTVGIVGKYVELPDAYLSVVEALRHGGIANGTDVQIRWIPSDDLTPEGGRRPEGDHDEVDRLLAGVDGVLVPGGFGVRGVEGKVAAARYARVHEVPYLGLCLGLQVAVVEFGRNVVGLPWAHSAEFEPHTPDPVIDLMPDQRGVTDKGGTMRLGAYPAKLVEGTRTRAGLRRRAGGLRAPPAPLRVQQPLPAGLHRRRPGVLRPVARRPAGGVHRAARAPVVRGDPGPSGAEVASQPAASAVRRVRGGSAAAPAGGLRSAAGGARRAHRGRGRDATTLPHAPNAVHGPQS
jgi:CTP synthase